MGSLSRGIEKPYAYESAQEGSRLAGRVRRSLEGMAVGSLSRTSRITGGVPKPDRRSRRLRVRGPVSWYHCPCVLCSYQRTDLVSEQSAVTGKDFAVIEPQPRALEWTNGVLATADGFVLAVPRWYYRDTANGPSNYWRTELLKFRHGVFQRSWLIANQWFALDYHPIGGSMFSSDTPRPHFIVLPPTTFD
jgi:hypothetical protein